MAYYTPLRYPGGKQKLFNYTKKLLENSGIKKCTYIEPFAGGAGLALNLLFSNVVENIVLNDIDRSIYAFWHSVLNETDSLCRLINNTSVTIEEWEKQREKQNHKDSISLLELGFSTFFLNRTNRSGIIQGGIIGGRDQSGQYKIDCRFNKGNLIKRIEKISQNKDSIRVYNLDAIELIHTVLTDINNAFIFFDPPYYKKGPGLYENHYTHVDHVNLSKEILEISRCPWIVTYDSTSEIKEIYSQVPSKEYTLSYSAQKRYSGKEIMFYSRLVKPIEFE